LDKWKALKIIENTAMIVAIISLVWLTVIGSRLEEPAFNPQLRRPFIIGVSACSFWVTALILRESRESGWVQAAVSIVVLVVVQAILYFLSR
jgi:hypothetical protein